MKTLLFSLAFLGLISAPALGDPPVQRKVTVNGTAIIKVAPDEMLWTVQISINDATLAAAKVRHDASLNAAIKYVKSLGEAVKDLQTGGIRFDKNLYPGDNAEMRKHPYSCSTQFTFTETDFDKYGSIADALSKLDGLQVQSVDYATSKEAEIRRTALKNALLDGRDKANDLAVTAGCYIDKPLLIEEQSANGVRPEMFNSNMGGAMARGGTPAAVAGQIEITAQVTATYDLYYK